MCRYMVLSVDKEHFVCVLRVLLTQMLTKKGRKKMRILEV